MIRLSSSERGQGFLEYGLAIVLVAVIVMLLLSVFGGAVSDLYGNIMAAI
ncbi:MAG: pilus assembly protein [Anaerolineae bacterium]|nr:pilus assembly protein [Anaerolineae bacterium]MBL6966203.1 pilus assembly protein [Anaerolineales bacterium]